VTRVSIDILRPPEDVLADAIAAADRRTTMDALKIRHNVVVDSPAPATAAGECRWCSTRQQLETMPDGKQRMPEFGRRIMSSADRRTACKRCVKTALGTLKRRVDAGRRPRTSGGTRVASIHHQSDGGAKETSHHVDPGTTGGQNFGGAARRGHDPLGTCSTCKEYRRSHPDVLTAGGIPQGCAPHAWNEKPRPSRWTR
jgi:hypothetical protein